MVGVVMGCQKSKILFRVLIEIYISCNNLFLQFLYYRGEINNLKRLYLCYLVVLLREVTYIEPIVEPCISKNQKEIFGMWVCLGRKS